MKTGTTRNVMLGLAAVTVTLMAGCAGESGSRRGDPPAAAYQEDIDRAAASIAAAEREGAHEHGAADIARARAKLNEARQLADDGELAAAQRLAVEADLDADVALATERNATAQAAANELNESIRTLEEELRRNETRNSDRP